MELFWEAGKPLTSVDLTFYLKEHNKKWNNGYPQNLLKSLTKKGMLKVTDIVQYSRQFARQYEPTLTKEQYAAKIVMELDVSANSISKVALAMVDEISENNKEKVISELEQILAELKRTQ